jgi:hypothetical protein
MPDLLEQLRSITEPAHDLPEEKRLLPSFGRGRPSRELQAERDRLIELGYLKAGAQNGNGKAPKQEPLPEFQPEDAVDDYVEDTDVEVLTPQPTRRSKKKAKKENDPVSDVLDAIARNLIQQAMWHIDGKVGVGSVMTSSRALARQALREAQMMIEANPELLRTRVVASA